MSEVLSKSICHLIPNDRKFFDHVASVMEAVNPGRNRFVVAPGLAVLKLENATCAKSTHVCETFEEFDRAARRAIADADGVIAHSLEAYMGEPLTAASPETPVLWAVWGGDLAEAMPVYRYATLLRRTAAVKLSLTASAKLGRRTPGPALERAARMASRAFDPKWWPQAARALGRTQASATFARAAARVDLYAALEPMPGLAEAMPGFTGRWVPEFKYYVIDVPERVVAGPDILIGNRATPSCNHLEAFDEVQRAGITEGRIVLPLNYGSERYGDVVEAEARRLFGDRVFAIRTWMPYDEYTRVVAGCGTVLMNFRRGQALGTTALSLAQGARVLLRKDNLHYRHYTRLGVKVFALDVPADRALLGRPMEPADQELNRRLVGEAFSRRAVEARTAELLDEMRALRSRRSGVVPTATGASA